MPRNALISMGPALVFAAVLAAEGATPLAAQESPAGPRYSLSADASAGFILAADALDPESADSAAGWVLQADLLHRIEAPGWGFVLSHAIDLSGQAAAGAAFSPTLTVHEAYARLDLGEWAQLFVGKRRMGVGVGTTFSPGDAVDPRTGFWDQKSGFRGMALSASLGSDVALRAALGLDRNLDAYAAALKLKGAKAAAIGQPPASPEALAAQAAQAAYDEALGPAAGPADPRLFAYAASAEAQLGRLLVSAAGVYSGGLWARPSIGASVDIGGIVLQAEGAVELEGAPDWLATCGVHWSRSSGVATLVLQLDYDYGGAEGLLEGAHYILSYASFGLDRRFSVYARSLVDLEGPSALLSAGLTLYPAEDFDLELTGLFGLGGSGTELGSIGAFSPMPSAGTGRLESAVALAARVHF